MPRALKQMAPRYQRIESASIPEVVREGARVRVIAGEFEGAKGPAETLMPLFLWHVSLGPGAQLETQVDSSFEAGAYVIEGEARFGNDSAAAGRLAIWGAGEGVLHLENEGAKPLELLVLGGAVAEGPLVFHGPFVMNSVEQIRAAEVAYRTGRMGTL